jgi:inositol transport system permease protein
MKRNHFGLKTIMKNGFLEKYGIVFILFGFSLFLSFMSPAFLSVPNIMNVVRQVSIIGVIAIGVTFVIITRGIDLSSGSVVALVGVIIASLSQTRIVMSQPVSMMLHPVIAITIGLVVGLILGVINGVLTAYGRLPAFIATLGMMTIARGGALLYTAGRPVTYLHSVYTQIGTNSIIGIPIPIWIYLVIAVFSHILLSKSVFGRHVFAIGGNEQSSRLCGINVNKTLVFVYAYAGFLSAVAGMLLLSRTAAGNPSYGVSYELDAIASTVIGGTSLSGGLGSIPLCVVGALIIGVVNNGMDLLGINAYYQQIVKGLIIIIAVLIDMNKHAKE